MATILIMDDEEAILGFLKERLMYEGFNVLTAIDGIEGLKLFNENQIDLVIGECLAETGKVIRCTGEISEVNSDKFLTQFDALNSYLVHSGRHGRSQKPVKMNGQGLCSSIRTLWSCLLCLT